MDEITVNGETYRKVTAAPGKRVVLVVDRGWIFAGDLSEQDGRLKLTRALHIINWQRNGFSGLCADPKAAGAKIDKCADVDVPKDCELFRVPVGDSWGL
jgi:hypothetical protein